MIQTFLKEIFQKYVSHIRPDVKSAKNRYVPYRTSKASPLQYKRLPPAISLEETEILMTI